MPQKAAILISRQPLYPSGEIPWVRSCRKAVEWIRKRGCTLITSTGLLSWDIPLTAAIEVAIPVHILVPVFGNIVPEEAICEVRHHFAPPPHATLEAICHEKRDLSFRMRDRMVVDSADILLPISIRPGGFFEERMASAGLVNTDFMVPYQKRTNRIAYSLRESDLNTATTQIASSFLIHWTRTAHSHWPTETVGDLCRAILAGTSYPRTAFYTLRNMLESRVVKATDKNMPQKRACVCFSSAPLTSFISLMSWRRRYRHMSFEPYGIGIRKEYASGLSILPVLYCKAGRRKNISPDMAWRMQGIGARGNWPLEQEYRHAGDLHLTGLPADAVACFCRTEQEAERLRGEFNLPVYPLLISQKSTHQAKLQKRIIR